MDRIIASIFNPSYIKVIELETPDPNFPDSILGIGCEYCERIFKHDADKLIDHLQHTHDLKIKQIVPSIKV